MAKESPERRRFEILLEEVRSELRKVAEGHTLLDQKFTREIRESRAEAEERFKIIELALMENANAIKENSNAIKENSNAIKENSNAIKESSSSIKQNSTDIRKLQEDIQILQQDIRKLADRVEAHERAHTG